MASITGDAWGILGSACWGSLCWLFILGLRTVPNVSAYRPDHLFRLATAIWGGHPNSSRLTKGLQDRPLIMALGKGPRQG